MHISKSLVSSLLWGMCSGVWSKSTNSFSLIYFSRKVKSTSLLKLWTFYFYHNLIPHSSKTNGCFWAAKRKELFYADWPICTKKWSFPSTGTLWSNWVFRSIKEQGQGAFTCPVETMTGSFINSRDIGQRKSSGKTGALWFLSVDACPLQLGGRLFSLAGASMLGFSVCTKSLICFSSIDIFSMLSPGSPPLEATISCKASDSWVRSTIPINCKLSANLRRTAGSVDASFVLL